MTLLTLDPNAAKLIAIGVLVALAITVTVLILTSKNDVSEPENDDDLPATVPVDELPTEEETAEETDDALPDTLGEPPVSAVEETIELPIVNEAVPAETETEEDPDGDAQISEEPTADEETETVDETAIEEDSQVEVVEELAEEPSELETDETGEGDATEPSDVESDSPTETVEDQEDSLSETVDAASTEEPSTEDTESVEELAETSETPADDAPSDLIETETIIVAATIIGEALSSDDEPEDTGIDENPDNADAPVAEDEEPYTGDVDVTVEDALDTESDADTVVAAVEPVGDILEQRRPPVPVLPLVFPSGTANPGYVWLFPTDTSRTVTDVTVDEFDGVPVVAFRPEIMPEAWVHAAYVGGSNPALIVFKRKDVDAPTGFTELFGVKGPTDFAKAFLTKDFRNTIWAERDTCDGFVHDSGWLFTVTNRLEGPGENLAALVSKIPSSTRESLGFVTPGDNDPVDVSGLLFDDLN